MVETQGRRILDQSKGSDQVHVRAASGRLKKGTILPGDRHGTLEAMYHYLPKNWQRFLRETLKSAAVTSLGVPPAMVFLCAFFLGVLATLIGLSGTEVMLDFIGAAAGPITLFQTKLMLVGFLVVLCLFQGRGMGRSIDSSANHQAMRKDVGNGDILAVGGIWRLQAAATLESIQWLVRMLERIGKLAYIIPGWR